MTDVEILQQRVAELEAMFVDTRAVIPSEWRLTQTEDRVFRVLLAVDVATRAALQQGADVKGRGPDVHILRIRRKAARFGVVIETVHSHGWRLVGRVTWARSLAAQAA